ncbi:MAG TPA: tyrosine-type recombinase/integrase [Candidatus Blautia faecipullorum]|nr:tyrosine-type recombinase/integrase [Candidatus Blautia faecipullorum]
MKMELKSRIMQLLIQNDKLYSGFSEELEIILGDYDIGKRSTELSVVDRTSDQALIQRFITAKVVKGLSERSLQYYTTTIRFFLDYIHKNITEVTSDDIRLYIAMRVKRDGVTDVTAGNELRNLRSFYNWLYTEELIKTNPVSKVESIKQKKTKKEAFTEYEIELIRNACRTARETAIVEVLLSTGCRVNELAHIKRDEVKENSVLVHGKGNKDRTVYLNAKAHIAIERYMSERSDKSEYIFPKSTVTFLGRDTRLNSMRENWYKEPELVANKPPDISSIEHIVRDIGKRAGVEKVHPHRFRRTCATLALRRGMPIEQVSRMLGHEQISTTQIYLDLSEQDLEQAHRKYVV